MKTSLKCSGAITQVCLKEIRSIPLTFSLLDLELLKPLVSLEDSVLSTKHARANTKAIRVTVKSRRNPKTFSRFRPQLLAMLTEAGANNWLILAQWHIACYSLRDKEETRQNPVSPDGFYVGLRSVLTNDIPARQFVASHHSTAKLDLFQLQLEVPLISVRGMHSLFEVKNFLRHSEKRKELNANFLCSHFSRNLPPWSFFFVSQWFWEFWILVHDLYPLPRVINTGEEGARISSRRLTTAGRNITEMQRINSRFSHSC